MERRETGLTITGVKGTGTNDAKVIKEMTAKA